MLVQDRRKFLGMVGVAAASGYIGLNVFNVEPIHAAQQVPQALDFSGVPDEILNPVEVTGNEAIPIIGRLPGARRMYMLPAGQGETHLIGDQVLVRLSRPEETGRVHELMTFAGRSGSVMPRHAHLASHTAVLVMSGDIEFELDGKTWRMMRGDFANIPPGTPHAWTMRSDKSQLALFSMGDRVGAAFVAMGASHTGTSIPAGAQGAIPGSKLAAAAASGDFQLMAAPASTGAAVRVTNKSLPSSPGPYVLADGGGERYGGNTFLAKNSNSGGQFLFLITEGGSGPAIGAHFHARHFENFFAMDGTTMGWAHGKAVPLKMGDYFQAPPRNLHGFKLTDAYNRFAAFLTPGIFEDFFIHGLGGASGPPAGSPNQGPPPAARQEGRPEVAPAGAGTHAGAEAPKLDMFRAVMMSAKGSDGYPLDVHGPTQPLPPQDPIWTQATSGRNDGMAEKAALMAHGMMLCSSMATLSREISPELRRAMKLKPKPESFV